jgi:hypothetical protein
MERDHLSAMNPSQKSFSPESFVLLAPEWGVAA